MSAALLAVLTACAARAAGKTVQLNTRPIIGKTGPGGGEGGGGVCDLIRFQSVQGPAPGCQSDDDSCYVILMQNVPEKGVYAMVHVGLCACGHLNILTSARDR